MTHISDQPFSILGDPGTVSRDDAIFSGKSLLLDVNFCSKISPRSKISRRLTAPGGRPRFLSVQAAGKILEPTV